MKTHDWWAAIHKREYRSYFLVIIAAYAAILLSLPFSVSRLALLVGLGIVYTLTGLFGLEYTQHVSSWPIRLIYLVEQIVISGAILYFSQGTAFLLLAPLAAYGVVLLPRRGVVAMCALLLLVLVVVDWSLGESWRSLLVHFLSMLASFVFVTVFTRAVLDEAQARTALDAAHQRLREYAAQIETMATIAERNRLAREIHDNVGHYLTSINIQLAAARALLEKNPVQAGSAIEKAQGLTREGLGQIRGSVAALRTLPTENRSLLEALTDLVQETQHAGIAVRLSLLGTLPQLSSQVKFTLYRIAQEGLTNVRKHAQAQHIELILDCSNRSFVKFGVKDDGVGAIGATEGFGLLGARERVQALGGQLRTAGKPGAGFLLEVELPL